MNIAAPRPRGKESYGAGRRLRAVRTDANRTGLGSLVTGAVTALGIAVQTGLAAVVGVVIARKLGRAHV